MMVHFIFRLGTSDTNLFSIHDHDVVAGVDMRRIFSLVLATQTVRYLAGQAPESLVSGVHDKPVAVHSFRFGTNSFHQ